MENSNQIKVTDANAKSGKRDKFTRRGFLGIGSAALAAAGIGTAMAADRRRMTVVATGNRARTMDFQAGDVGYVEKTLLHYIENTGDADLVFLEMFKSSFYQDLSLSEWLAHTPPELVMAHLRIDKATFA